MLTRVARRVIASTRAVASPAIRNATVARTAVSVLGQHRFYAADKGDDASHDDFKPKYHAAPSKDKDSVLKMIEDHVKTYPIMLYMKGTPSAPQCGFSMQVVRILHAQGVSFDSVNILDHPEIREGVKEYSQWPTIPQLYVNGEFVGGCDIVTDMHKSGELTDLLSDFIKKE